MSRCCEEKARAVSPCSCDGKSTHQVTQRTVLHHVKRGWEHAPDDQLYFFCENPGCDVVYFTNHGLVFSVADLRTEVNVKTTSQDAWLCYCFGIRRRDFKAQPDLKEFVIRQTKLGLCACETKNPSGMCCLKDFRRT